VNVVGDFSNRFRIAATVAPVALALAPAELDDVTGGEWTLSALYQLPAGPAAIRDALRRPIPLRALARQAVEGVSQPIKIYTSNFAWA
jgi:hypothetical protein